MHFEEYPLHFCCHDAWLYGIASLPVQTTGTTAPVTRGVMIVVGGPQYRAGSHRQFTLLARHLAAQGIPVLRFDYRGMGDSDGQQRTFEAIHDDLLCATNTFFERVSAPIKLAIALLKDRHGRIDIKLPVTGSLDDPQFSVGSLLLQVFVNLIAKAATAPFALLGSLFDDAEQMSSIEFLPGESSLSPDSVKRLEALSKMLADRPALNLEITGRADLSADVEGLKRTSLDRKIKTEKLSDTVSKGKAGDSLDNIELTPEEYAHYLELAYKAADFAKPTNIVGLTKSLPASEMEKLMLANINAGDEEMRNLANRRANTAVTWLLEKGGLKDDRIFVLEPKIERTANSKENKPPSGGVSFSLNR